MSRGKTKFSSSSTDDFDSEWESLLNDSSGKIPSAVSKQPSYHPANHHLQQEEFEEALSDEGESSSESETEEDEFDEINPEDIKLDNFNEKLNILLIQMEEIRKKYIREVESRRKIEQTNKDLLFKVADLEEENAEYQDALKEKIEHSRIVQRNPTTSPRKQARRIQIEPSKNKEQDIRLALIDENEDDDVAIDFEDLTTTRSAFTVFTRAIYKAMPFKRDVREIQASFGGAVGAYYNFFRWMIFNFSILGGIGALFSTIHIVNMIFRSSSNTPIVMGDSLLLPGFMLFSSFLPSERFQYTLNVIVFNFTLTGLALRKIVVEDIYMKRADLIDGEHDFSLSKDILGGWDHSLTNGTEVTDLFGILAQAYREKLTELISAGAKKSRSNLKILELYGRRILVSLIYLTIQFASYAAIVFLTVQSQSIQNGLKNIAFLKQLSTFIVPAAVTAINSSTPWIYERLTEYELWDSGQTELNMLLIRMYLSNMANLLILAISYAMLADPFMLADNDSYSLRQKVEQSSSESFTCRMNQAASGMFSLILTEFALNGLVYLAVGYLNIFVNRYIHSMAKKEFNIAQRMVSLLYFVSLMTLTFPFAPLSVIFFPLMLSLRIKWEKYISLQFYSKPKSLWAPHKAGSFFAMFFLISILVVALPASVYFLSRSSFPKSCALQDHEIGLCDGDLDTDTNICELNPNSDYYVLYSKSSYCSPGYPDCICQDACGPFIDNTNAFAPFRSSLQGVQVLDIFWEYIVKTSYGAWVMTCLFYVVAKMRRNTIKVNSDSFKEKEKSAEAHIQSLENDKKKHEKIIQRLKLMDGQLDSVVTVAGTSGGGTARGKGGGGGGDGNESPNANREK